MTDYIKHLIGCRCVLPQFKQSNPIQHHYFVVFSIINDDGSVQPSFEQCSNCQILHKITEISVSSILNREEMKSLINIDDIKGSMPDVLIRLIEKYEPELCTWKEIKFILDNEKFPSRPIILTKDKADGLITGKYLTIFGSTLFKVDVFVEENE